MRAPIASQVRVRTLHARCRGDAARTVVPALEAARWPMVGPDEWVFVRRVEASGPLARIADQVVASLRSRLAGGEREVVRFASEAQMLAALLADIAGGRAGERWYWRDWHAIVSLPTAQALGRVMQARPSGLAAASAHLAADGELGTVWAALDEGSANAVSEALAAHGGHRLAPGREAPMSASANARVDARTSSPTRLPPVLMARWLPVLARLPRRDARRRLALQLIAMESAPLALLAQGGEALAALDRELPAANPNPRTRRSDDTPVSSTPGLRRVGAEDAPPQVRRPTAEGTRPQARADAGTPPLSAIESMRADDPVSRDAPDSPGRGAAPKAGDPPEEAVAGEALADLADPTAAPVATGRTVTVDEATAPRGHVELPAGFIRFETEYGGLFRLANMLTRPEALAIMLRHADALPAGWGWLYRLGSELGFDDADPLAGFIAERLALDGAGALDELPPLPAREAMLGLALRWYSAPDLWGPALLRLSARVEAGPTHVDVYSRLRDVRVDVRIAGLDLDPGWLPWLGCVLRFHHD